MNELELITKLDTAVSTVFGGEKLNGFKAAYTKAKAIGELKELLTDEYMKPIMQLQSNRLGFKTDKDLVKQPGGGYTKGPGYSQDVVRNCLIEAVLMGVEPTGNMFNIIGGNCYITKEGCGHILNTQFSYVDWKIVCNLTKINVEKTSALVDVTVTWKIAGEQRVEVIPIPIKMDSYTSVDAIIGKATRKGRAWLISTLTGIELPEGQIEDTETKVVSSVYPIDELKQLFEEKQLQLSDEDRARIESIIKEEKSAEYLRAIEKLKSL